jgi:hypothetical protein
MTDWLIIFEMTFPHFRAVQLTAKIATRPALVVGFTRVGLFALNAAHAIAGVSGVVTG